MDLHIAAMLPWVWDWSANAWAAAASWATFGVAVLAARFARHQVIEARRTREEQAQPFVVVDFEPSIAGEIMMNLVIRNTGTTVAKNVKIEFSPLLQSTLSKKDSMYDINKASLILDGIPTLPPGKMHSVLFESMPELFNSDLPRIYEARVSFLGPRNQRYEPLTYRLDLNVYFGVMNVTTYGSHHTAKALINIEKTMKKWTAHFNGVRVYVRDEDALLDDQRAELDERRRQQSGSGTTSDAS